MTGKLLGSGGLLGSDSPGDQSARLDQTETQAKWGNRSHINRTGAQGSAGSGIVGGKAQRGNYGRDRFKGDET